MIWVMSSINPAFSPRRMSIVHRFLENPRVGWALIFRPCLCVMAKRLRDVCTCRKANRSGALDAASSSSLDL
jgi:hypothetical protein